MDKCIWCPLERCSDTRACCVLEYVCRGGGRLWLCPFAHIVADVTLYGFEH